MLGGLCVRTMLLKMFSAESPKMASTTRAIDDDPYYVQCDRLLLRYKSGGCRFMIGNQGWVRMGKIRR